ncbi:MAG: type II toxin-antitoxin system VapC family toxin [bacterium]
MLVDTGPLVAIVDAADKDHDRCAGVLTQLTDPLVTTWSVITEATYLLAHTANPADSQDALLAAIERQIIVVAAVGHADLPPLRALLRKYRDLPMDLADATLVRVAERDGIRQVFTLDRRDFDVYRIGRRETFTIIP